MPRIDPCAAALAALSLLCACPRPPAPAEPKRAEGPVQAPPAAYGNKVL